MSMHLIDIFLVLIGSYAAFNGYKLAFFVFPIEIRNFYIGWPVGTLGLLTVVYGVSEILK